MNVKVVQLLVPIDTISMEDWMGHKHKPECGQQIGGYTCTLKLKHKGRWHKDETRRGTWVTEPVGEAA